MNNILSPEDIHEGVLLSDLPTSEHPMGSLSRLGMIFTALELSYT